MIAGITAPVIGVADADLESAEFGDGFFFGGRSHPGDVFEADAKGGQEVGDEGVGLRFGFGREETFDVELANGVSEGGGDEDVTAEGARTLLCGSGESSAEEGEALVGEGLVEIAAA